VNGVEAKVYFHIGFVERLAAFENHFDGYEYEFNIHASMHRSMTQ
jgi:hypothetical protein